MMQSADNIPSFVRVRSDAQPSTDAALWFDWWMPVRCGDEACDWATGAAHAREALALAIENDSSVILSFALIGMMQAGVGATERGFIAELSRKAVAGTMPPPLSDNDLAYVASQTASTVADLHDGYRHAVTLNAMPSDTGSPDMIEIALLQMVEGKAGPDSLGYALALFRAAMNGSRG